MRRGTQPQPDIAHRCAHARPHPPQTHTYTLTHTLTHTHLRAVGDPVLGAVENVTVAVLKHTHTYSDRPKFLAHSSPCPPHPHTHIHPPTPGRRECARAQTLVAVVRAAPASEPLPGSLSAKHPCARGSARVRARVSAGGCYGQTDRQTDRQTEGCAENALGCWRMLAHASCWRTRSGLRVREDDALTSLRPLAKSLRNSAFWAAFPNLEMGSLQVSFRVSTFEGRSTRPAFELKRKIVSTYQ